MLTPSRTDRLKALDDLEQVYTDVFGYGTRAELRGIMLDPEATEHLMRRALTVLHACEKAADDA